MSPGKIISDHFDPVDVVGFCCVSAGRSSLRLERAGPRDHGAQALLGTCLGCGDVLSHGCYNECIMSVTFLDLHAFCQNRLTLILDILAILLS